MSRVLLLVVLVLSLAAQVAFSDRLFARYDPNAKPFRNVPDANIRHRMARAPPSTFSLTYTGNPSAAVRSAIEYAVALVDSWLVLASSLPIRINFTWVNLTSTLPGVLGAASPAWTGFASNEAAALWTARTNTYLVGLSFEIIAQFNLDVNWFLGTDGNVGVNQFDLVTVFLHELIHGLGFSSLLFADDHPATSLTNYNDPITSVSVYDAALYENAGTATPISTWAVNDSDGARLLQAEQSNSLIFRPTAGADISIYSPNPYEPGSSGVHLDPTVYPGDGADSLMRPWLTNGKAYHHPGQHVFQLLVTLGHELKPAATSTPAPTPPPVAITTTSTTASATVTFTSSTAAVTVSSTATVATTAAATVATLAAAAATSASHAPTIAIACQLLLVLITYVDLMIECAYIPFQMCNSDEYICLIRSDSVLHVLYLYVGQGGDHTRKTCLALH